SSSRRPRFFNRRRRRNLRRRTSAGRRCHSLLSESGDRVNPRWSSNTMTVQLTGAFTALITPFRNQEIDESALRSLVEFQITNGIHGLVPCGTTGESATMTEDERRRV